LLRAIVLIFLSGARWAGARELRDSNVGSRDEPFAYKHKVQRDDFITCARLTKNSFLIADVYYDYSSERGNIYD